MRTKAAKSNSSQPAQKSFLGFFVPVLLAVIGALSTFTVSAQTIELQGRNGEPLEAVTIRCDSLNTTAITDEKGRADITDFKGGKKIVFRYLGYQTAVWSYTDLAKKGFLVRLEAQDVSLADFTVIAGKWRQEQDETPQTTVVLDRKQIETGNPQTSADLLGQSGLVYVQKSQQGGGSPMIRGFAANRVLLQVDGVRMNNAIFRSGNLQNVISIDPLAIQKTEVLFGPGSVVYGSDAIGGVMGFYTLPLKYDSKAEVNLLGRYSSANDELTQHVDASIGGAKLAYTGSFSTSSFGDLEMGKNGPDDYLRPFSVERRMNRDTVVENEKPRVQLNSGYEQWSFLQKLGYRASSNTELSYSLIYSETSDFDRYDRLIRTENGLPTSAEWYYGPQVWMMNHFKLVHRKKHRFFDDLSLHLAHQRFKESRHFRNFGSTVLHEQFEEVHAASVNLDFQKKLDTRQGFAYGIDALFNDVSSNGSDKDIVTNESGPGPARYPKSQWSSLAGYVTYSRALGTKVNFQSGIRYNQFMVKADFDTTFYPFPFTTVNSQYGALTGSAGFTVRPKENLVIKNNYATGFRAPNIDDLGKVFDSEPGAVVVPNPSLRPEYAYNVDLGFAHEPSKRLGYGVTVFATLLNNAMVRRGFNFNGADSIEYAGVLSKVQAIQNAAQTTLYGFQAHADFEMTQQFTLYGRFNYQNGEEELEDGSTSRPRHAAPWFGNAGIRWEKGKTYVECFGVFNGGLSAAQLPVEESGKPYLYALNNEGLPYVPSWSTFNLRSGFDLGGFFQVNMSVENIFNVRYRPYSSGIAGSGRNLVLSMRANLSKLLQ